MTTIKITGVRSYDRNGQTYHYLRALALAGKELYDLGLGREARKVFMAHRTKLGDEAVRMLNRHHAESRDAGN